MTKTFNNCKKITKNLILAGGICILFSACSKQPDNQDKATLPNPTVATDETANLSAMTSIPSGSYDLTKSLPKGYVKNGSVDYTSYIQSALSKNSNVTFPAFPIMIDDRGLLISSNSTLNFLSGSSLVLKPTSSANYDVLRIDHGKNITLNNPVIIGDAQHHLGSSGEWGNGIGIYSSSNITVNSPNVSYCWGDGMYLSTSNGSTTNTSIKIVSAYLKYNRRDGMSITSVNGLDLESPYAAYSTGTSPMCGINFEPGSSSDELQNIIVNNAQTGYNGGKGIQISYSNLYGGSSKTTSITFNNPNDKRSDVGFKASALTSKRKGSEKISGTLTINNAYWRLNSDPLVASLYENNIRLKIVKPAVEDADGDQLTQAQTLSNLTYKTHMLYGSNYSITF